MCVCVDVHVQFWLNMFFMCVFVCMFMSSVWLNVFFMCVFVWMFISSIWLNVFFMCVCMDVHVQC